MAKSRLGYIFLITIAFCSVLYLCVVVYTENLIRSGRTPLHNFLEGSGYNTTIAQVNRYNFIFGRHLYGLLHAESEETKIKIRKIVPKFSKSKSINFKKVQFLSNPETWMLDGVEINSHKELYAFIHNFKEKLTGADTLFAHQLPELFMREFSYSLYQAKTNMRLEAEMVHVNENRVLMINARLQEKQNTSMTFGEISFFNSSMKLSSNQLGSNSAQTFYWEEHGLNLSHFLPFGNCKIPSENKFSSISTRRHISKLTCYLD